MGDVCETSLSWCAREDTGERGDFAREVYRLRSDVDRLTRERDEAREDAKKLRVYLNAAVSEADRYAEKIQRLRVERDKAERLYGQVHSMTIDLGENVEELKAELAAVRDVLRQHGYTDDSPAATLATIIESHEAHFEDAKRSRVEAERLRAELRRLQEQRDVGWALAEDTDTGRNRLRSEVERLTRERDEAEARLASWKEQAPKRIDTVRRERDEAQAEAERLREDARALLEAVREIERASSRFDEETHLVDSVALATVVDQATTLSTTLDSTGGDDGE